MRYDAPCSSQLDLLLPQASARDAVMALDDWTAPGPCIARVPLSLFFEPAFVAQYVRSGSLYALGATKLDTEDTVCLDGQGMLVLSLSKDTYQTLGLVGRPSRYAHGASGRAGDRTSGPSTRYIVELPLLAPSFVPGRKGYERARTCIEAWDAARGKWALFFVWTPPQDLTAGSRKSWAPIVFPSSVCAADVHPVHTKLDAADIDDAWIPCWNETVACTAPLESDQGADACTGLLEWAGLAALHSPRLRTYDRCDATIAQYTPMAPSSPGRYWHLSARGIFPPSLLLKVQMAVLATRPAWAVMTATGFTDTPVAWRSKHPGLGLALGSGASLAAQDAPVTKKARHKGHTRRGEAEHGMLRTGENGWTLLMRRAAPTAYASLLVASVELDTHL
ncbi:ribonuclease P [Malassezia vespertilionis]|uniref:ribonuclease P n=1 Tax=Malassezia vespertilionis TaxID=2020962 RepID=UPI0024B0AEA1|nr:ribonuclease P [Malassezia vespertilionis]WFD06908.1 ribonuclease P [Malassezia vespertilionis]